MRIKSIETSVLLVPLDTPIGDAQLYIERWGVVVVQVRTDAGIVGFGYNSNIGAGGQALKVLIDQDIAPRLLGKDIFTVKRIWEEAYLNTHFTGITGVAVQGLAAVEIAMWDAIAKHFQQPLWKVLGGYESSRLRAYNTDGGWLSLPGPQLIANMRRLVDRGWLGVKMKVGSPDPYEDYERVKAVRNAIGPRILLMVDANNKWDLPTAIRWTSRLEEFDIFWMEEPLHPFDVKGHAQLASSVRTPLVVGENIYSLHMWRDFVEQKAVGIAQADALKLGGISTWLEVAALAHANSLPVVPAAWDMMQLDVHLCAAIPHALMVEYIPWILEIFVHPVQFADGYLRVPQEPGAGTEIKADAMQAFRVA
jgi:L-alanine-DL-glutamate epimerase-like enolase superfamily enzyme